MGQIPAPHAGLDDARGHRRRARCGIRPRPRFRRCRVAGETRRMRAALKILRDVAEHRLIADRHDAHRVDEALCRSVLGFFWIVLNPMLFLSSTCFCTSSCSKTTWRARVRWATRSFVFAGLIPFLAFMEASNGSVQLIPDQSAFRQETGLSRRFDPGPSGPDRVCRGIRRAGDIARFGGHRRFRCRGN